MVPAPPALRAQAVAWGEQPEGVQSGRSQPLFSSAGCRGEGAVVGLRGRPNGSWGRGACALQSSCSVLESGTCGRAWAPLLAGSVPRLPPAPGHEGTGSGRGRSPVCAQTHCPHQGPRLGLAPRQLWPGTEEVQAALVGALGELRQFSIGWFKKRPKPAKPDVPEARHAGGRVWGCSGFALSCHLDPACPKVGTDLACASPVPSITSTTATRNLQPNAESVKKGLLDIFRGDSGS